MYQHVITATAHYTPATQPEPLTPPPCTTAVLLFVVTEIMEMAENFSVSLFHVLLSLCESVILPINIPVCLFQPPVDYGSLKVTREHRIQAGDRVVGMCYHSGRLYTVERPGEDRSCRLAVYSVTGQDTVTLLDTLDLEGDADDLRADHQNGQVYIPCTSSGVCVVRYDGSKLVPVTTLRCVRYAHSLAVVSADTLYVCDWNSKTVCLVDVTQDRVTARLQPPQEVRDEGPHKIAVLGDTILVRYGRTDNLVMVIYRHGVSTSGKLISRLQGLQTVNALPTDHHSSFLLCDMYSKSVYVLDISGNLTHTVPIPGDMEVYDCTVVGGQLWVGGNTRDIIVMSSQ